MPELPDVEIYRKEAGKARDATIDEVKITDKEFIDITPQVAGKSIKGTKITNAARRGKYLWLELDHQHSVVMHFGMTGLLQYTPTKEEAPEYTKCSFVLDNKHSLHYISKRKLGFLKLSGDIGSFIQEQDLGPDALELKEEEFIDRLKKKRSMIKTALNDQSLIAGIGNIYADEILYQAGIHPKTGTGDLTEKEFKELYKQNKKVLETAIEKEADVSRFPEDYLLPHREEGTDCSKCSGKIKKIKVGGRGTYYCPSCQKKK